MHIPEQRHQRSVTITDRTEIAVMTFDNGCGQLAVKSDTATVQLGIVGIPLARLAELRDAITAVLVAGEA